MGEISKRFTILGIILIIGTFNAFGASGIQTDWSGGPGETGPVGSFGNTFDTSTNINWLYYVGETRLAQVTDYTVDADHIADRAGDPWDCQVGDIDGDGDLDIVISGRNCNVEGYRNNGNGTFNPIPVIMIDYNYPGVNVHDFQNDSWADMVETDDDYIYIYHNKKIGYDPEWTTVTVSDHFNQVDGTGVADFDKDGDEDIVGSTYQNFGLRWYENDGVWPPVGEWTRYDILSNYQGHHNSVIPVGDLDGDTYVDFAICCEATGNLDVWLNLGVSPYFDATSQNTIGTGLDGIRNAEICDMDGDDDLDIVSAAQIVDSLDWWENDGSANFTRHNISSSYDGAYEVSIGDIDLDGDMDIFSTAFVGDTIDVWVNDGNMDFASGHQVIATDYNQATGILIHNIDTNTLANELITCNSNGSGAGSIDYWVLTRGFITDGELTSSILDTGGVNSWGNMSWNANTPGGTTLKFQVRGSDDSADMGAWSADITSPGALSAYFDVSDRYIQYKAMFSTTDEDYSPVLQDITFTYSNTSTDEGDPSVPHEFALESAYPNPAYDFANISFALPHGCDVSLDLYDISGRKVSTLTDSYFDAGNHTVMVSGLISGVYVYQLQADNFVSSKKMVIK